MAVTRDGDPDDRLVPLLDAEGARVVVWPTLAIAAAEDPGPLTRAAARIADYDWVVFTSARAVDALSRLVAEGRRRIPAAVVGGATASAAERAGWDVVLTGSTGAEQVAELLVSAHDMRRVAVLFPAASLAGEGLEEVLTAAGASVERVEAYRTIERPPDTGVVRRDLSRGVDFVTFASPSAARALSEALGGTLSELRGATRVVAIGPSTEKALDELGAHDAVVASEPSLESLVEACASAAASMTGETLNA